MTLITERRGTLLAYCRLEEFADDAAVQATLDGLYAAAVGYMDAAGVSEPPAGTNRAAQYDLCVNAMVLDWWEHRDTTKPTATTENPAFRRLINQLKLTEPVSDLDTVSGEAGT